MAAPYTHIIVRNPSNLNGEYWLFNKEQMVHQKSGLDALLKTKLWPAASGKSASPMKSLKGIRVQRYPMVMRFEWANEVAPGWQNDQSALAKLAASGGSVSIFKGCNRRTRLSSLTKSLPKRLTGAEKKAKELLQLVPSLTSGASSSSASSSSQPPPSASGDEDETQTGSAVLPRAAGSADVRSQEATDAAGEAASSSDGSLSDDAPQPSSSAATDSVPPVLPRASGSADVRSQAADAAGESLQPAPGSTDMAGESLQPAPGSADAAGESLEPAPGSTGGALDSAASSSDESSSDDASRVVSSPSDSSESDTDSSSASSSDTSASSSDASSSSSSSSSSSESESAPAIESRHSSAAEPEERVLSGTEEGGVAATPESSSSSSASVNRESEKGDEWAAWQVLAAGAIAISLTGGAGFMAWRSGSLEAWGFPARAA